jgi:hypothetical protein
MAFIIDESGSKTSCPSGFLSTGSSPQTCMKTIENTECLESDPSDCCTAFSADIYSTYHIVDGWYVTQIDSRSTGDSYGTGTLVDGVCQFPTVT